MHKIFLKISLLTNSGALSTRHQNSDLAGNERYQQFPSLERASSSRVVGQLCSLGHCPLKLLHMEAPDLIRWVQLQTCTFSRGQLRFWSSAREKTARLSDSPGRCLSPCVCMLRGKDRFKFCLLVRCSKHPQVSSFLMLFMARLTFRLSHSARNSPAVRPDMC